MLNTTLARLLVILCTLYSADECIGLIVAVAVIPVIIFVLAGIIFIPSCLSKV